MNGPGSANLRRKSIVEVIREDWQVLPFADTPFPKRRTRPIEHYELHTDTSDYDESLMYEDEEDNWEYELFEAAKKTPEAIAAEKEDLRLADIDRKNITPEQAAELAEIKGRADQWLGANPNLPTTSAHHYINKHAVFPEWVKTKETIGKHFDAVNPKLNYAKDAHRQQAADVLTHDVMRGLSKNSSAHGWYDRTVDKTLHKMSEVAPEILKNPEDELAFKLAVAICSQNQEVHPNFESGYLAYRYWKQNGQMPTEASVFGGGTKSPAMVGNFNKINELWREHGADGLRKILEHPITIRDLKEKYGIKVGGESPDYVVEGAALLGPKIGSFFNNLNKRFHTTTFDMWASRNLNRLSGSMLKFSPGALLNDTVGKKGPRYSQLTKLQQLLESGEIAGPEAETMRREIANLRSLKTVDREKILQVAPTIAAWADREHKRYAKGVGYTRSYPKELKSAATSLAKNIDLNLTELADAPRGPVQRKQWRDIFARVKDNLAKAGIETNQANLQAILWFAEQQLFQLSGSRKKANADYLDAAHRVVRKIKSGELPGLAAPAPARQPQPVSAAPGNVPV